MARRLHFWAFMAILIWAPLPLGSNRPWSWTLLAVLFGILAATAPAVMALDRGFPWTPVRRIAGAGLLFGAVLVWAALQGSTVLPQGLAHPIWSEAATGLPAEMASGGRAAVDRDGVLTGIMRLICYGAVFWLAFQHGRSGNRARLSLATIALASGVYALYGLAAHFSGSERILWMPKLVYQTYLTGTFINPNSYAAYAGLGLIASLATVAIRLQRRRSPAIGAEFLDRTGIFAAVAFAGLLALLGTGSRAGIVATACGVAVLFLGIWIVRRPVAGRISALSAAGGAVAGVGLIAGAAALRFGPQLTDAADRLRIYGITLDLIAARPWTGYGLGSFPTLFASVRPDTVTQVWNQAHNVYLELALDLGIPAAAVMLCAILWLLSCCVRGMLVRRRDGVLPASGLAASALIGSHSLLDFSVQIPAVAVTWMALLGVAVAQSWSEASQAGPRIIGPGGASSPRAEQGTRSAEPSRHSV
ncbi:MAG: O-antigen ligase family protein [Alphaproteobacteria bacterium]